MNRHHAVGEPGEPNGRFSRLGKQGVELPVAVRTALARAMTRGPARDDDRVPAGYTYLGQFLDHDLTMDATTAVRLGEQVGVEQLVQGRSPALDLDSLYGFGPVVSPQFYADGVRLRTGTSAAATEEPTDPAALVDLPGADLPRVGVGPTRRDRRAPLVPDHRNDENVAVAQLHAAFIRLHNRVVDRLSAAGVPDELLFEQARETTVRHYQWMVRTDYLPRVVDPDVVAEVFADGRRFFEVAPDEGEPPTAPVEFTVAAFRFGHSMVREAYQWNRVVRTGGVQDGAATLAQLFRFTGVCGNLSPTGAPNGPDSGTYERLPSTWAADFRRLFDFTDSGRADLVARDAAGAVELNHSKRVDTRLVDPLAVLPTGSFGGRGADPTPTGVELNLAFRNLTRAGMVKLGSGQQLAEQLGVDPLTEQQILVGDGHAVDLTAAADLTGPGRAALLRDTPLWFYVLREAELAPGQKNGKLAGVGARIVAEVFHRAIEGSRVSTVRDPHWRPWLGPEPGRFLMTDLLLEAFHGQEEMLNPLGD